MISEAGVSNFAPINDWWHRTMRLTMQESSDQRGARTGPDLLHAQLSISQDDL